MKLTSLCLLGIYTILMYSINASCEIDEAGITQPSISDNRTLQIGVPEINSSSIPMYGKFEASFTLQGTYRNAFDPDEIDVIGVFRTPDGKTIEQPAFFYQDYTRKIDGNSEVLHRNGNTIWKILFSPIVTSQYSLTIRATDSTKAIFTTKPIQFACTKSNLQGFIRISKNDSRYFAFEKGRQYFPIGANICWGSSKGTYDYDSWLPKYSAAGCNYFRLWMGPGPWVTTGLEKTGQPEDRYGAGKFDQAGAWRLDYIIDLAAKNNQYVMLCIDSYNTLRKKIDGSYPFWEESPLNAANGGPLTEPIEFWTNPEMQRIYRNKLRYLTARYGWSTNVLSWEFWNEVDIISPVAYDADRITDWHIRMSDYMRKIDNWKHLQTTSFAFSEGMGQILTLPQIEYTQTHNYGSRDISAVLSNWQLQHEKYKKPHIIAEFGADAAGSDAAVDPTGIALHNGLWASVLSGGSGTAMSWWWDNHIDPHNLYSHYAALSGFLKNINFEKENFQHITRSAFTYAKAAPSATYKELMLQGAMSWEPSKANKPTTVDITSEGKVTITDEVSGLLHGVVNHADDHNPLTITTDLPHPVKLRISVTGVSGHGGAHLVAKLDGNFVLDKDMPDPDERVNLDTLHQYDGIYEVIIPSGRHSLVIENIGTDWIFVDYMLENAVKQQAPDLALYGLRGKTNSIMWIQNTQNQWYRVGVLKLPVEEQKIALLTIPDWPDGEYLVKFWDTYKGKSIGSKKVTVDEGKLSISLPPVSKDIALLVERLNQSD
ncbi:MAG: cellulase family glycosylhydrolase [Armatimonadota bacterium]